MNNDKVFTIACYLALVDHHGVGWRESAPTYLIEKMGLIGDDVEYAFAKLDMENQARVVAWCRRWGIELPKVVQDYLDGIITAP